MNMFRSIVGLVIAGGMLVSSSLAKETATTNPYKKLLRDVPVLELPAQAAKMIQQAKEMDRETVTIQVIGAISELKPAAVPAVVGTVARNTPAQAATAAAAATHFQPELAVTFVKSATAVAPKMASAIVKQTCQRAPRQFPGIALAAAQVAPSANLEILAAVSAAIPEVKPAIQQATAAVKTAELEPILTKVPEIIGPAKIFSPTADPKYPTITASIGPSPAVGTYSAASGPIVGPPFKPLTGVPAEIAPVNTYEVAPGTRNYAAP